MIRGMRRLALVVLAAALLPAACAAPARRHVAGPAAGAPDAPLVGDVASAHPGALRLAEMLRAIEREDEAIFLEGVSDDILPSYGALRADLRRVFSETDEPRVLAVLDRVDILRRDVEIAFHWDREWRLAATGDLERRAGSSVWIFTPVPDGGNQIRWVLLEMRGDRLF